MAFRVKVQLRDADDVFSPAMSKEDAEADLAAITAVLSASSPRKAMMGVPKVSWLSAMGQNIIGANVEETNGSRANPFS